MMEYMEPASDYQDARLGALSAAWDIYGDCSEELIAVIDAWHAVGVGTAYNNNTICFDVSIEGPYSLDKGQGSSWSANVSEYNGNASYSYQWFRSYDYGAETMVSSALSYSTYMPSNVINMKLRLVVTANGYKVEQATKYISCNNCSNECDNPYAINAYPNPVVSRLTVELKFPTPCKIAQQQTAPYTAMIFDESTGALVFEETFYGNEYKTERFARLPKGTYALKLIINEKVITQHLIKE